MKTVKLHHIKQHKTGILTRIKRWLKPNKTIVKTLKLASLLILFISITQICFAQPSPPPPPTAPSGVPIDGGVLALIGGLGAYLFKRYFKKEF